MRIAKFKMLIDGIYEFIFRDGTKVIGSPLNLSESTYIVFKDKREEFNENCGRRHTLELVEAGIILKVNPEEIILHTLLSKLSN